jgi:hypothetical protein
MADSGIGGMAEPIWRSLRCPACKALRGGIELFNIPDSDADEQC